MAEADVTMGRHFFSVTDQYRTVESVEIEPNRSMKAFSLFEVRIVDATVIQVAAESDFSKQLATRGRELEPALADGPCSTELAASLADFILEGLHCHNRVNKRGKSGGTTYGL